MTKEDKVLLLKDIFGRVLYGLKVRYYGETYTLGGNLYLNEASNAFENYPMKMYVDDIENVMPFLRSKESMTAAENIEYQKRVKVIQDVERILHWCDTPESIDWLNENHFDYRGLIGKGLALEASDGMYNNQ